MRKGTTILATFAMLLSWSFAWAQAGPTAREEATLTGIVLVTDWRCFSGRNQVHEWPCGDTDWGFVSRGVLFKLFGDSDVLTRYERKRVKITGTVKGVGDGSISPQLVEHSLEADPVSLSELENLVQQLRVVPWKKPVNRCNPTCWDFALTEPMKNILAAGPEAQEVLLRHVNDRDIKDQVLFLLGGVGDEGAIVPIIEAMATRSEQKDEEFAARVNLAAELALTNLTEAGVNWHHGGGITVDACPDDPKACWYKWWTEHGRDFKVPLIGNRRYSNYPNYGIYEQP